MKYALAALAIVSLATPALAQHEGHGAHAPAAAPAAGTIKGTGVVKAVNAKTGVIKLHHAPIPALKWPAMTMDFKAAPAVVAAAKVGKSVTFTLNAKGDEITSMQ
ncbi:MAG: copper-binding protein [Phenylobacterium zucineum]|nr:MAG: copper-binding protein [Phenylobacterium zucineum]